jgi:hypothetical protein
MLSDEARDTLVKLVRAALEEDDTFIGVSGGFSPPFDSPYNVRMVRGARHHVRGSENHCVWAYRTLKAEGRLDGAIIPKWFWDERWLDAYGEKR